MKKTRVVVLCLILCVILAALPLCAFAQSNVYLGKMKKTTTLYTTSTTGLSARKGETVLVKPTTNSQVLLVMNYSGTIGYVYTNCVSYAGTVDSKYFGRTKGETTVYKVSGGTPHAVGSLPGGVPVAVSEINSGYAKIKTLNGLSGYVRTSSLKH